jgi:hypothetical protein
LTSDAPKNIKQIALDFNHPQGPYGEAVQTLKDNALEYGISFTGANKKK